MTVFFFFHYVFLLLLRPIEGESYRRNNFGLSSISIQSLAFSGGPSNVLENLVHFGFLVLLLI